MKHISRDRRKLLERGVIATSSNEDGVLEMESWLEDLVDPVEEIGLRAILLSKDETQFTGKVLAQTNASEQMASMKRKTLLLFVGRVKLAQKEEVLIECGVYDSATKSKKIIMLEVTVTPRLAKVMRVLCTPGAIISGNGEISSISASRIVVLPNSLNSEGDFQSLKGSRKADWYSEYIEKSSPSHVELPEDLLTSEDGNFKAIQALEN